MFEVGAVVHAGCEHHHRGLVPAGRSHAAQGGQQQVGVVGHRGHAVQGKQVGKEPHHHLAVLEHVAHARRHAKVVFQHMVGAAAVGLCGAHDVDAGDVGVYAAGHIQPHHLGAELRIAQDFIGRDDAGPDDVLAVVHIVDEAVERRHPLLEPALQPLPLGRRNDARQQVKGNEALGARAVLVLFAIDREGDAHPAEDDLGFFPAHRHGRHALPIPPPGLVLVT